MKVLYMIFLLIALHSTAWASDKIPTSVTILFSGICYDHCHIDVQKIEEIGQYKKIAEEGKIWDDVTVEDVEKWYKFKESDSSYPFYFTYSKQDSCEKKFIHTPKGTRQPDEAFEELIKNENTFFHIIHNLRSFNVSGSYKAELFNRMVFNPVELLFCDPDETKAKVETVVTEDKKKVVSWTERDSQRIWFEKRISFLFETEESNSPVKSLIVTSLSPDVRNILFAEMDSYQSYGEWLVPSHVRITECNQPNSPINSFIANGVELLPPGYPLDIQTLDGGRLEPFLYQWDLEVISVSTETMDDSVFWPDVPEGYTYNDFRDEIFERIKTYGNRNSIPPALRQLHHGKGPFKISRDPLASIAMQAAP